MSAHVAWTIVMPLPRAATLQVASPARAGRDTPTQDQGKLVTAKVCVICWFC